MSRGLVNQALEHAVRLHQAGDLAQAEAVYRQVLVVDPGNADATHLLGVVAHARGNPHEGAEQIARAVAMAPGVPHYRANLASALRDAGRSAEAAEQYAEAMRLGGENPELLNNLGIVLLQSGRDAEAAERFVRSLELRPDHPGALANLSSAYTHLGRHGEAVACAARSAEVGPGLAPAHAAHGMALAAAGRAAEARDAFTRAVALDAGLVEAHIGLSGVLGALGEARGAVGAAGYATQLRPQNHAAWMALGVALLAAQRREEAVQAFGQAAAILPGFGPAYANMGVALSELGRHPEALDALRRAAELSPEDPTPRRNLAVALDAMMDREGAVDEARRALAVSPEDPASLDLLATLLGRAGRAEESLARFAAAAERAPEDDRVVGRLGAALERVGRYEESARALERAVALAGEAPIHRLRLGMARLRLGDFGRGWRDLEARLESPEYLASHPPHPYPRWRAAAARPGDHVLVSAEQGFGDAVQFVRFADLLRARCARVTVEARPEVAALLATAPGVDAVVPFGTPPPRVDAWIPAMSLPGELGVTPETVPAAVPYLSPDPVSAAAWRMNLAAEAGLRVGLVWAGNPAHELDFSRTVPEGELAALAGIPGVRWFSLQKGRGAEGLDAARAAGLNLRDLGPMLTDFSETAAAVQALDLVVSVDTAVAHVAGALARPVFILLHHVPEWRWMLGRADSPWYPTARLFRQDRRDDWPSALGRVREAVSAMAAARGGAVG